jgi:hypothetical protein
MQRAMTGLHWLPRRRLLLRKIKPADDYALDTACQRCPKPQRSAKPAAMLIRMAAFA